MTGTDYGLALAGVGGSIIRANSGLTKNDYSALGNSTTSNQQLTEIRIDKIEVRNDSDLEVLTQGLYNKQDQNLRALGRRTL